MKERTLLIEPRDPVIFRDGKPFNAGQSSRSVGWPAPSAVIGAIRTRLARNIGYDQATIGRLRRIEHVGPFLASLHDDGSWRLAFPAPADVVPYDCGDTVELRPLRPTDCPHDGTDLPPGLKPLMGAIEKKPSTRAPSFWTADFTLRWLAHGGSKVLCLKPDEIGYPGLLRHRRVHVSIEAVSQSAKEGMLFATEGLEFERKTGGRPWRHAICSRFRSDDEGWADFESVAPLGGERRLAYWSESAVEWPVPPAAPSSRLIRLQLVTPACFKKKGWMPGWLGDDLVGAPPVQPDLKMRLHAAAVPRPTPLSGWDLEVEGPKATRFLAPAGSVYFFELLGGGSPALWMKSICDVEQDRCDGFGLVLCGEWKWP